MNSTFEIKTGIGAWAERKIREYRVMSYLEDFAEKDSSNIENKRAFSTPIHRSLWTVLKDGGE